jgi:hypothetical protein
MDRKWEIPRKWLIIDQMPLGEGEFGQVLRATVTSVTGISGKTTHYLFCFQSNLPQFERYVIN